MTEERKRKPKRPREADEVIDQAVPSSEPEMSDEEARPPINLFTAIDQLNASKVEALIEAKADVNVIEGGRSPLFLAVSKSERQSLPIVTLLLEAKADPKRAINEHNHTPFSQVITKGQAKILSAFLKFELITSDDINKVITKTDDNSIDYPLLHAAKRNHLELLNVLLEANVSLESDAGNIFGIYPAMREGHFSIVKRLLEANASPHERLLQYAVDSGWVPMARLLLDANASISTRFDNQNTLLHLATGGPTPSRDMVSLLIEYKQSVDAVNADGQTPLIAPIRNAKTDIALLLLEKKATFDKLDRSEKYPIDYLFTSHPNNIDILTRIIPPFIKLPILLNRAKKIHAPQLILDFLKAQILDRQEEILIPPRSYPLPDRLDKILSKTKKDQNDSLERVNTKFKVLIHSFIKSLVNFDLAATKAILAQGELDVNAKEPTQNKTPLEFISRQSDEDALPLVEALLEAKADCRERPGDETSPLSMAVVHGRTKIARRLLEAKASAKEITGQPPMTYLQWAAITCHPAMAKLLLEFSADINAVTAADDLTALDYSAISNDIEMISCLVEAKASINLTKIIALKQDEVRFHKVLQNKLKTREMLETLVKLRADIMEKNTEGNTPLHIAAQSADQLTIEFLLEHKADVAALNNKGESVLDLFPFSKRHDSHKVFNLLLQKNPSRNLVTEHLLHKVAFSRNYSALAMLLESSRVQFSTIEAALIKGGVDLDQPAIDMLEQAKNTRRGLALLAGLHGRVGGRGLLKALDIRSSLFDKQVLRLPIKLGGT